ncbi:MAG: NifB/NifX family molybdenum-iron cluster-binding protein [Desulfofustis sp.]|nr:NifB/NifX family molybdenum-iron cluster-binding protein [Desulfofustis sp.]NNF46877.1 NifB/NifX family molybdenum-iron cluster-binding protein [Desulfofustis sp.]NNK57001.1 NifB/NifX family molybdenum-iron cluster-binding protein [Desulfofustis sp.]
MKVAITARGADLSSEVDPRFGRAANILIIDLETMEVETIDNSVTANSFKGAGIQAATMVHDRGAEVLMTGYCGPKAFQTLQAAGIRVVSEVSGTVGEALERFRTGEVQYLDSANAESHW